MWMLRGWRTQGRGHASVDGVEVEGAGKSVEVYLGWQWDMVQARDEVGQACCIGYVASPMWGGGRQWDMAPV